MGSLTITVTNLLLLIGIVLIIITLLGRKNANNTDNQPKDELEIDNKLKEIEVAIEAANKGIKDLNELHAYMMTELTKKQNELMLMYEILDEKEKRVKDTHSMDAETIQRQPKAKQSIQHALDHVLEENETKSTKDEVLALHEQGQDIESIAKKLHIGKREAKLFVELSRPRGSNS